jgi:hypothetical protein
MAGVNPRIFPIEAAVRAVKPLFVERGEAVTYRRRTGTIREGGRNVDQWEEFEVVGLGGHSRKWRTEADGAKVQAGGRTLIFRAQELPEGVTLGMLTKNDQVDWGGQTYEVTEVRGAEGYFVRCALDGA